MLLPGSLICVLIRETLQLEITLAAKPACPFKAAIKTDTRLERYPWLAVRTLTPNEGRNSCESLCVLTGGRSNDYENQGNKAAGSSDFGGKLAVRGAAKLGRHHGRVVAFFLESGKCQAVAPAHAGLFEDVLEVDFDRAGADA